MEPTYDNLLNYIPMNDTDYHRISEEMLNKISEALEPYDKDGALEVELQGGILSIDLPSGKQLLLSKHLASKQLWLSSPLSGGLHFSCSGKAWLLEGGRTLPQVLSQELKSLAGINVDF